MLHALRLCRQLVVDLASEQQQRTLTCTGTPSSHTLMVLSSAVLANILQSTDTIATSLSSSPKQCYLALCSTLSGEDAKELSEEQPSVMRTSNGKHAPAAQLSKTTPVFLNVLNCVDRSKMVVVLLNHFARRQVKLIDLLVRCASEHGAFFCWVWVQCGAVEHSRAAHCLNHLHQYNKVRVCLS